jgi:hypothetical protein
MSATAQTSVLQQCDASIIVGKSSVSRRRRLRDRSRSRLRGMVSVMTNIVDYICRPAVFEPEVITAMGDAYERALGSFDTLPAKTVREVIAGRIIRFAQKGEHDPGILCEKALEALGVHSKCEPVDKPGSARSH